MLRLINAKRVESHAGVLYNCRFSEIANHNSANKNIPTFEDHLKWYKKEDLSRIFLIWDNKYVGYIRVSNDCCISIAIDENNFRKGYASFALSEIIKKFKNLRAEILENNRPSIKLFTKYPIIKLKIMEDIQ